MSKSKNSLDVAYALVAKRLSKLAKDPFVLSFERKNMSKKNNEPKTSESIKYVELNNSQEAHLYISFTPTWQERYSVKVIGEEGFMVWDYGTFKTEAEAVKRFLTFNKESYDAGTLKRAKKLLPKKARKK